MKAKELVENNLLTNIDIPDVQLLVFIEVALFDINMAREEGRQEMKKKAIEALWQSTIVFPNDTDIKASGEQQRIFIEKLNS